MGRKQGGREKGKEGSFHSILLTCIERKARADHPSLLETHVSTRKKRIKKRRGSPSFPGVSSEERADARKMQRATINKGEGKGRNRRARDSRPHGYSAKAASTVADGENGIQSHMTEKKSRAHLDAQSDIRWGRTVKEREALFGNGARARTFRLLGKKKEETKDGEKKRGRDLSHPLGWKVLDRPARVRKNRKKKKR